MGLKRFDHARYGGHDGPLYLPESDHLTRLFDHPDLSDIMLAQLGEFIYPKGNDDHFVHLTPVETVDGYRWFHGMAFRIEGANVILAVPYYRDELCHDDTFADRCVAAYWLDTPRDSAERVLRRLAREAPQALELSHT